MYAEFLVASIGSLAYAEDDGRHILGIKVARSPASIRAGTLGSEGIDCHVLECESEVYTACCDNILLWANIT